MTNFINPWLALSRPATPSRIGRRAGPAKPLRVVTVGHSYIVGLNRAVMARVARRPGIELTIVAPNFFHGDLRPLHLEETPGEAYELRGITARLTNYIHIFYYKQLRSMIEPGAFDLVHAWEEPYILAGFQVARAASAAGARYMFRTAQSLPKAYPPPFRQFEEYCIRSASGWVAGGHMVQHALKSRGGYPALSEVITLAVDEEQFHPDPAEGEAIRRRLGLTGPVLGFVGRLTAAKGLDVLMKALENVPGPWSLLALGSGPYDVKIRQWAEARGLSDRVKVLLARHEEMPRYLRAMDILVAPSQTTPNWKEQFGRMIIEAFATRVPVIGSDSGEIPYVIADAGLVVPEADPTAWAEAICTLLSSPGQREALAEAGLERFQASYNAPRVAERYVEFYHRLMDVSVHSGGEVAAPQTLSANFTRSSECMEHCRQS
jgi:glycosyltransferase involved in cell wall biosynthesis